MRSSKLQRKTLSACPNLPNNSWIRHPVHRFTGIEQIGQKCPSDGRAEVSDVEALRDVRRRVFDHDFIACTGRVRAILRLPDGASYLGSCTCVSTARKRDGVLSIKCMNALSWVTDSTKSSAWNYATADPKETETDRASEDFISQVSGSDDTFGTDLIDDRLCKARRLYPADGNGGGRLQN